MDVSKEVSKVLQALETLQQELEKTNQRIDALEKNTLGLNGLLHAVQEHMDQSAERLTAEVTEHTFSVAKQVANYFAGQDLEKFLTYRAGLDTARFIIENMNTVPAFKQKYQLLDAALEKARKVQGMFLEFGVFQGDTINYIAERAKETTVYGFDSFQGLPETWRTGFEKGDFSMTGFPAVRENVELVQGYFDASLPEFLEKHGEPCAFIHVDSDLYSSARTIFELLAERIVRGTVIVFDEFFNYPGWEDGECKAFAEFLQKRQIRFEYIGYTQHEQVAVQIH